jgi:hypothetical protein
MWMRIIFALWLSAPWLGTWKLSKPDARYKRVITRIEPWEDGIRVTYDMVGTRGGVTHMEWTGKFDGKDYPVEGVDYVLTNAYKLINDHSYEIVIKVDGSVAATAHVEVSADGKTLTTVTSQKSGTSTTIYDKQ